MKKAKIVVLVLLCFVEIGIISVIPATKAEAASNYNHIKTVKAKKTPKGRWIERKKGYRFRYTATNKYAKKGWYCIKNKIYYIDTYRITGIKKHKGNYYYLNNNGVLKTGWRNHKGHRYYFKPKSGEALIGWQKIGGVVYCFDSKGRLDRDAEPVDGGTIFIGDSRTVGMQAATGSEELHIAKVGEGYRWFTNSKTQKELEKALLGTINSKVVINLGVNDLGNVELYVAYYRQLIAKYPETNFYFLSVNPVEKTLAKRRGYNTTYVNNTQIKAFNKKVKAAFRSNYIDSYTYLTKNGYIASKGKATTDGIHYKVSTSKRIYNYVKRQIK